MTSAEEWVEIKRLFSVARSVPRAERDESLERACSNEALRSEVRGLLAQLDSETTFLEDASPRVSLTTIDPSTPVTPIAAVPEASEVAVQVGQEVGPYVLLERLGRGGMGEVFLAEQQVPLGRLVALKVLRSAHPSEQVLSRFESERRALASLNHPNIAQVYSAGSTHDGQPYLAMEYVPGDTVTAFCESSSLPFIGRLELAIQVCRAIHHCHLRGLLHRDIKPSNLLVCHLDGRVVPKVIDFGVAKALQFEEAGEPGHTRHGQLIGTPEYASPEQLAGDPDIDTRSDVWALGVVIHEVVTGVLPKNGVLETERVEGIDARQARQLGLVLQRALTVEREERYPSAEALAEDLERLIRGEPVSASEVSLAERARRTLRRHRVALVAAGVLLLCSAVGLLGLWSGLKEARGSEQEAQLANEKATRAERQAFSEAKSANAVVEFLLTLLKGAAPSEHPMDSVTIGEVLDLAALRIHEEFEDDPRTKARIAAAIASVQLQLGRTESSKEFSRSAIRLLEVLDPPDPESIQDARVTLVDALICDFELAEAEALVSQCWSDSVGLPNEKTIHYTLTQSLAQAAILRGEYSKAVSLLEGLLDVELPSDASGLGLLATTFHRLGKGLMGLARFGEAEGAFREAIEVHKISLPEGHPSVAGVRGALGRSLSLQGKSAEAEDVLRASLAALDESLGPDDSRVTRLAVSLAQLFFRDGRVDEAEVFVARVMESTKDAQPWSRDRATSLTLAANLATQRRDYDKAIVLLDEALLILGEISSPSHPNSLRLRLSRARAQMALERLSEAFLDLGEVRTLAREHHGARDQVTVAALALQASVSVTLKRSGDVLAMLARDIDALRATPIASPDIALACLLSSEALVLLQLGRSDEALVSVQEAKAIALEDNASRGLVHGVTMQYVGRVSELLGM